jgi:hypothetical protein
VNNIVGNGTLGLNLVDNGSILDQSGDHLANNNGYFQPQKTVATGSDTSSVAMGDLNGDGKADMVAADLGTNTVNVMLSSGDGTFQAPKTVAAVSNPGTLVIGDVNGDGKPDLVFSNYKSNDMQDGTVNVLLGNGDGTFQVAKTFAVGYGTVSIDVADMNADGNPDLVVVNTYGSVGVLLGNGDGTFQSQKNVNTLEYPSSLAVADFNGDGKPDLAVTTLNSIPPNHSYVGVLMGNGDGTFGAQSIFTGGTGGDSVAAVDVNGDGKPDLVVTNEYSNNVSVLLGDGNGLFQGQKTFAVGSGPYSLAVADVNGDGSPDLVVANSGDTASVLLNLNNCFPGQTYTIDQPTKLFFTNQPTNTLAGSAIDGSSGVQVSVEDSSGGTVSVDSSALTLTLRARSLIT